MLVVLGKAPLPQHASYKLSEIPAELEAELAALERWRLSPINMSRKGVAVTAVTSQKQRENVVRLLGWLVHKKKLARPTLNAFGSVQIGAAVQLYINFLVDEKQRKYSSIAVYLSLLLGFVVVLSGTYGSLADLRSDINIDKRMIADACQPAVTTVVDERGCPTTS